MERGDTPPYWQPPATLIHRRRQRPPSPFLNSSVLIIVVPSLAILFIFVSLPYFLNSTPKTPKTNNFSPNPKAPNSSVKIISWDYLNIFLVLLAILCGVFARGNDDAAASTTNIRNASNGLQQRQPPQYSAAASREWYERTESEEQKIYTPPVAVVITPLRPDLRQEGSAWESARSDRLRFLDDFEPNKFHQLPTDACAQCNNSNYNRQQHRTETASEEASAKEIPVDTFVVQSKQDDSPSGTDTRQQPPQPPATRPPPPPHPPASREQKQVWQSIPSKEKAMKSPTPPPPVPPALPTERQAVGGVEEKTSSRSSRKKSNATREFTSAIASLYNQGKRKKKQRQVKNDPSERQASQLIPPPPPPPPLPPPPSVFHQFFRKGSRGKKIHSVPSSTAPPPPPPPPPKSTARRRESKSQITSHPKSLRKDTAPEAPRRRASVDVGRPPLPVRSSRGCGKDDNPRSRRQVRLIPDPTAPPPTPPVRSPVQGDFVRVRSAQSSGWGSPDVCDAGSVLSGDRRIDGDGDGDGNGPSVTCPSPDVNMKADSFIARLHDGWKLEKMNSWREKQKVGQNVRS